MTKVIKKTAGQIYIERIQAQRALNANAPVDLTMTASERAKINESLTKAGRGPITDREILQGFLNRQPSIEDRLTDWRPSMPVAKDQMPFAREIAEAEDAVRQEQFLKLSPSEKRLQQIKELSLKKLKEQATAEQHTARLADPKVSGALAKLRELERRTAFDPSWAYGETQAIQRAIEQLLTPGADVEAGLALTKSAFDIESGKRQAIVAKAKATRAELDVAISELDDAPDATSAEPATEAATDGEWTDKWIELANASWAKKLECDALALNTPREARQAAYAALTAANDAVVAHKATKPAEVASG